MRVNGSEEIEIGQGVGRVRDDRPVPEGRSDPIRSRPRVRSRRLPRRLRTPIRFRVPNLLPRRFPTCRRPRDARGSAGSGRCSRSPPARGWPLRPRSRSSSRANPTLSGRRGAQRARPERPWSTPSDGSCARRGCASSTRTSGCAPPFRAAARVSHRMDRCATGSAERRPRASARRCDRGRWHDICSSIFGKGPREAGTRETRKQGSHDHVETARTLRHLRDR
jgi:hypothetical protein